MRLEMSFWMAWAFFHRHWGWAFSSALIGHDGAVNSTHLRHGCWIDPKNPLLPIAVLEGGNDDDYVSQTCGGRCRCRCPSQKSWRRTRTLSYSRQRVALCGKYSILDKWSGKLSSCHKKPHTSLTFRALFSHPFIVYNIFAPSNASTGRRGWLCGGTRSLFAPQPEGSWKNGRCVLRRLSC